MSMSPWDRSEQELAPCRYSVHCLRLFEDIEQRSPVANSVFFEEEREDGLWLDRVREHAAGCATCSELLARLRRERNWQRAALRALLGEGEQRVPSTTGQIMQAVRREYRQVEVHESTRTPQSSPFVAANTTPPQRRRLSPLKAGRTLRSLAALAAVAIMVMASLGLFGFLAAHRSSTHHPSQGAPAQVTLMPASGWTSFVVGLSTTHSGANGQTTISNYEPQSGQEASLVSLHVPAATHLDGVSHDGHNLLYHFSLTGHTYYYTLHPLPATGSFFTLDDEDAGSALWLPDSRNVLVMTKHSGVIQVDTQTGREKTILNLNILYPQFYRDGFLYYRADVSGIPADLYRVNLANGSVQHIIEGNTASNFMLTPDGTTIFYVDLDPTALGRTAIWAIKNDGTNKRILRHLQAMPLGYAADNALELLQYTQGRFRLIKLGVSPGLPDVVMLNNVAPGAVSTCVSPRGGPVCAQGAALSPYGRSLVVQGTSADGRHTLWFNNLMTGKTHALFTTDAEVQMQLPGWDRLQAQ